MGSHLRTKYSEWPSRHFGASVAMARRARGSGPVWRRARGGAISADSTGALSPAKGHKKKTFAGERVVADYGYGLGLEVVPYPEDRMDQAITRRLRITEVMRRLKLASYRQTYDLVNSGVLGDVELEGPHPTISEDGLLAYLQRRKQR